MAASGTAPEVQQAALRDLENNVWRGHPTIVNPLQSGRTDLVESMTVSVSRGGWFDVGEPALPVLVLIVVVLVVVWWLTLVVGLQVFIQVRRIFLVKCSPWYILYDRFNLMYVLTKLSLFYNSTPRIAASAALGVLT